MTVSTRRRPLRTAVLLITAALTIAGYLGVAEGIASATDATATASTRCITSSKGLWGITITFTNQWDGSTTFTVDTANGGPMSHTVTGNGATWSPTEFVTSEATFSPVLSDNHPEHFHSAVAATLTRPAACTPPATTTPPSTTTTPTVPTTAPVATTVPVCHPAPGEPGFDPCGDCSTPDICTGYLATTTTTAAKAKIVAAPPRQGPPPSISLPATGNGDAIPLVGAGLAALMVAVILLVAARRPRES